MISARTSIATVGILATTFALAGCGSAYVQIDSPNGVGACGADAVSLNVSQNDAGDQVTIGYDGPSDVSLVAYQGVYSDSRFWGQGATESFVFSYPVMDEDSPYDYAINSFDFESAPWTVTTVGSTISAVFDGSTDSLIDSFNYRVATAEPEMAMFDKLLPVTIAVICEPDLESALIEAPTTDSDEVIENFSVAVAQPLFPNFMYVDAPTVLRQRHITNGVRGQMVLPAELVDALPADIGDIEVEANLGFLGEEDPYSPATDDIPYTLDGASLGEVWVLTLEAIFSSDANDPTLQFVGAQSLTDPMTFEFTGPTEPEDGFYIVTFIVGDTGDDPDYVKVSTAILSYSSERGLTLRGVDEPPVVDKLAATGSDPNAIIWAVLGGLVVLAAVFLRPKRRKVQAESTNDPSDLKG